MLGSVERLQGAIADRYMVEREIGRGGMATVYLARDLRQDRPVAIKVLHQDLAMALGPERFRREIQLANQLSHPHIVPLYDSGEVEGSLFYVMPYIQGESLRSRLDRERQLPVNEAARIACEVAAALDFAHRRGIIHRDIKPENILLQDGQALVADFGIARAVSAVGEEKLTQTGVTLGTPTYMSPEQATAERNIDGRSDVYSLGCVLYEMLSGQPPFVGPTAQAIIARHTLERVPSLVIVRSSIPDEVEDVVMRALAKVPADRFATAAEFAEALRACQESGGLTLGRAERRATPRRRGRGNSRRWVAMAVLALSLILIGASLALWRFGLHPSGARTSTAANGELTPERIAVLYFDDLSADRSLGPLADGFTEDLIGRLQQVKTLDVVSPNGVAAYKETDVAPDSVARVLGAGTVVRGSIEKAGSRLRVAVRLVDGSSGVDFKRGSFEYPAGEVLTIGDKLAQEVGDFLRERLGEEIRLREQRAGTRSAAAWMLVRRGEQATKLARDRELANDTMATAGELARADSLLRTAEAADPAWVDPIVLRGFVALRQAKLAGTPVRAGAWIDSGLALADRALRREPRSAATLELRGTLRYERWNRHLAPDPREAATLVGKAERDLRQSVTIDPSRASAWSTLALVYFAKPDLVEGTLAARRAYEEDAYLTDADVILWRLYTTSYDNERFVDAVHWCDEGRRRFPSSPLFVQCQLWLMTTNAREPDPAGAWRLVDQLRKLTPDREWSYLGRQAQMLVAADLARAGLRDSADRVLVRARGDAQVDPDRELLGIEALIRNQLGERDEALRLLKVYLSEQPEHRAALAAGQSWWWRNLRPDPRFKELVGIQQ